MIDGSFTLVIAGGLLACLSSYIFFKLGENTGSQHFILQLLMISMITAGVSILGVAALDSTKECEWLMNETVEEGNQTSYEYNYQCLSEPSGVGETFQLTTTWFYRIFVLYMFFYIIFAVLDYFGKIPGKKNNNRGI